MLECEADFVSAAAFEGGNTEEVLCARAKAGDAGLVGEDLKRIGEAGRGAYEEALESDDAGL